MSQELKKKQTDVVLALFVNARGFGIAVLEDALTVINAYNVVVHRYPICNKKILKR